MTLKLKVDIGFTPCPVDAGDELFPNGIFEFNITKLLGHIQENPDNYNCEEIAIADFINDFSTCNELYLDVVEITSPVVLAEIAPSRYNVIDGNHRMEKARQLGIKRIQAYRLSVAQHIRFLTSKEAYTAYVAYWNSKADK